MVPTGAHPRSPPPSPQSRAPSGRSRPPFTTCRKTGCHWWAPSGRSRSGTRSSNRRDAFSRHSSGEAPAPLASAIPAGTTLRGLFISERGDAFVDLSGDVTTKHLGGALDELFTVYVIVNALTVNLPAITRVQILIDGKESDTLAGHVDLRHPLHKNLSWVTPPVGAAAGK